MSEEKIEPLATDNPDLTELFKALDYFKEAMMRVFSHIPPEPEKKEAEEVILTITNHSDADIVVRHDPKTGGIRIDARPEQR